MAGHDRTWRRFALGHALAVALVQGCWVVWMLLGLPFTAALALLLVIWILDLSAPAVVARWSNPEGPAALPWHPHHLAERYGLITIIAIGETVIGTVTAAREISEHHGWTLSTVLTIGVGVAISFALWWAYFLLPSAAVLTVRRDKVTVWAYGHLPLLSSIVAVGGGLHVLGYLTVEQYNVSVFAAVVAIAAPILAFMVLTSLIHGWLVSRLLRDPWHFVTYGAPVAGIVAAWFGSPAWLCLLLVLAGPLAVVLSYELWEHRLLAATLGRALDRARPDRNDE